MLCVGPLAFFLESGEPEGGRGIKGLVFAIPSSLHGCPNSRRSLHVFLNASRDLTPSQLMLRVGGQCVTPRMRFQRSSQQELKY